ncbi:transmembrane protein 138 [Ischnura elegans]|uniref:transmembrane protein 138 n=1 Tax=Ischnura elegans TaxID=197161 RepID=UPI001ED8AA60|nr:transmembrane protein 138 [Ischnura elegans]
MHLSAKRYIVMLSFQLALMLVDILINAFSDFFRNDNVVILVIYIVQDFCLVFSLISIFLNFFSTFIFQAGLIGLLLVRFRETITVCIVYLILTISLHIWSLTLRWNYSRQPLWTNALLTLFVIQRFTAAIYYFCYKRTVLRISDPRYYEDSNWIKQGTESIS